MMAENNQTKIDEMLEKVSSGNDSSSMNEFDRMAQQARADDLLSLARQQGKTVRPQIVKPLSETTNRYEYFMRSLDNVEYNERISPAYRRGHEMAMERYTGKVELNKNNLSIVDRMVQQELLRIGQNGTNYSQLPSGISGPLGRRGYYDGLKLVKELLDKSKQAMMRRASDQVLNALDRN